MPVYLVENKVTGAGWQGEADGPEAALKKLGWAKKDCQVTKVAERIKPAEEPGG